MSQKLILILFFSSAFWIACNTTQKGTEKKDHFIKKIVTSTMKIRRPPGLGADPKAGPGGIDYQSNPLPSLNFDCEPMEALFRNADLESIRLCLNQIQEDHTAFYFLEREAQPLLTLVDSDTQPECLKNSLPTIAVPREIVFQGIKDDKLNCYTSRLPIEIDEVLGIKLPKNRLQIQIDFPLSSPLKNREELLRLLGSWVLTLFWNQKQLGIESTILTDQLCKKCLGEKNIIRSSEFMQVTWPAEK